MVDMIEKRDGWVGDFTTDEALGAISNGSLIVKVCGDIDDRTAIGTKGKVLGSLTINTPIATKFGDVLYGYFVEWETAPKNAVFITDVKIRRV
jgi:hypothetical protein